MEPIKRFFSGSPWESKVGYCRGIRSGPWISISGTTATNEDGSVYAPEDAYQQTVRCFQNIDLALRNLGATRKDVVRTRMFVTQISRWEEFGRGHSEYFSEHEPATSMCEIKSLIHSDMLIEIEVDAYVLGR